MNPRLITLTAERSLGAGARLHLPVTLPHHPLKHVGQATLTENHRTAQCRLIQLAHPKAGGAQEGCRQSRYDEPREGLVEGYRSLPALAGREM